MGPAERNYPEGLSRVAVHLFGHHSVRRGFGHRPFEARARFHIIAEREFDHRKPERGENPGIAASIMIAFVAKNAADGSRPQPGADGLNDSSSGGVVFMEYPEREDQSQHGGV